LKGAARVLDSPAWGNLTITLSAFAAGVLCLHQYSELPGPAGVGLLALAGLGVLRRRLRVPAAFCLGLAWAAWSGQAALAQRLPAALEGADLVVEGEIFSAQREEGGFTRLVLRAPRTESAADWKPRLVRLSWYGPQQQLVPGERWRLQVRLKQPSGLMNPAGFDYERWLFAQGMDAVGYVYTPETAQRLENGWNLNRIRGRIADTIASRLDGREARGVIVALAVGERRWISDSQWEALRLTGTAHLVAISGLHVGLVALLCGCVVMRLWRLSATACRNCPARLPGVGAGIAAAVIYALLAGFTLPTQRALIMLLVPALALLARRRVRGWHGFGIALAAVLLWDPFAPLGAGFWLSFGAVGLLIGAGSDRARPGWLRGTIQTQIVASFGLLAISVVWLQTAAWISPLANAVAIPLVGLVVVPLTLLGAALLAIAPEAALPLDLAAWLMGWILYGLEWMASHAPSSEALGVPPRAVALAALAGLLLMLPRGFGARWLVVPLLVPLAVGAPASLAPDELLRLTVLDVGQGSAIVLEAGGEAAVYDAGPASEGFDAGGQVLLPYLRSRGYREVSWLFVSQATRSRSGGVGELVRNMDIGDARVGEPLPVLGERPACMAGERIRWQGLELEFLWPRQRNGPCVLRIHAAGARILLTGDLDAPAERALVRAYGEDLKADAVLVPRQGNRRSSIPAFVGALSPKYALVSTGYGNRYGYPHPDTVSRYQAVGAELHTTAGQGAIELRVRRDGTMEIDSQRRRQARYYHRRAEP
jgi:competence protein ComEC